MVNGLKCPLKRRPTFKFQYGTRLIWIFKGKLLQMVYKKRHCVQTYYVFSFHVLKAGNPCKISFSESKDTETCFPFP
jgi:hypothetical protein